MYNLDLTPVVMGQIRHCKTAKNVSIQHAFGDIDHELRHDFNETICMPFLV
jgi:hypothetical protein